MSPSRSERVRDLFDAAAELATSERADFLARECGGDPELRAEIDSLLAHDGDEHPVFDEAHVASGVWSSTSLGALVEAARAGALVPGTRVGHYTILGAIGSGGMGTVYEAEQDEPRRRVALKMLRSFAATPQLLERFRHEAQILGRLQHPGIAQIFEAGSIEASAGSLPYFAMELVEGEPLHRFAERHKLDARARIALVAAVCDAVGHAHERGVVHRDLKPDNVLVDGAGRPKVLDFGVARLTGEDSLLASMHTGAGELVGTLQYMSPEQVAGDPQRIDARSDVYALGAILYELLAAKRPYELAGRSLPEAARVIQEEEPARLGTRVPSLRGDVEVIVEQALAKEPGRRYADARELASDLRRFLADRPIQARPLSTFYFLSRFARRHRALVTGSALALASLVAALVISILQTRNAVAARTLAERESRFARLAAAEAALEADTPTFAREMLDRVVPSNRGWEWHYFMGRLDQSVMQLDFGEELAAATLSADASAVLALMRGGELERIPIRPGEERRSLALGPSGIRAACFSADGRRVGALFGTAPGRAAVWDAESGAQSWSGPGVDAETVQLELDGEELTGFWFGEDLLLRVWNARSGAVRSPGYRAYNEHWTEAPFATRKGFVALPKRFGGFSLLDPEGRNLARNSMSMGKGGPQFTAFALSDDVRRLAVGSQDKRVRVFDVGSGELVALLAGHTGSIRSLAFGPDSDRLVSSGNDGTLRSWSVEAATFTSIPTGKPGQGEEHLRSVRADGCLLMSTEPGRLEVWDPELRDRLTVLRGHTSYVYPVAFSPDGMKLVSGSWDDTIRLWDVASGASAWIAGDHGKTVLLAFSPDGARIAACTRGKLCLLDPATGEVVFRSEDRPGDHASFAWFPRGDRWLLGNVPTGNRDRRGALVCDARDGRPLARLDLEAGAIPAAAVAPNGRLVALGTGDGHVVFWEPESAGEPRMLRPHADEVSSLAFDPSGTRLVSTSLDGSALVIDVESGATQQSLEGHEGKVYSAAWSPDGTRIATGAADSIVRVFDPAASAPLLSLRGHDDYVYSVAFSPDGSLLASGSGDGTVRLWDARPLRERLREVR